MALALGIDVGTSAVKAVLLDDRSILARGSMSLDIDRPRRGWSEQWPDDWVSAAAGAVADLRANSPIDLRDVEVVGLSGQMHGAVVLDENDRSIRPAILWNDQRAANEAEMLALENPDLARVAGVQCTTGFTAPKLVWLRENEPDSYGRIRTLMLPKDYLRLWLTGERAVDISDAAGTWLLDEAARDWSPALVDHVGIDQAILPPLLERVEIAGALRQDVAETLGLRPGIPVAAGGGDAAAGGIGLGMIDEGDAFVSLGTSAQLFVANADYRPVIDGLIHSFAHGLPGRWYQMGVMLNGASALDWWSRITSQSHAGLADEAMARPVSESDPIFLPYLAGERTPHNDADPFGCFIGLTASSTRGDMTRAVMEGVALGIGYAMTALRSAREAPGAIGLTGGGARSAGWSQMMADALGVPAIRYQDGDIGPALGAARMGLAALSGAIDRDLLGKPEVVAEHLPHRERHDFYRRRAERFDRFYQAIRLVRDDPTSPSHLPASARFQRRRSAPAT